MIIKEKVSILIPIYNIGDKLKDNIKILKEKVNPFLKDFEIILSDDGSSDNSLNVIKEICEQNTNVYSVSSSINYGKGNALKRASEKASGEYIVFCDSDMEIDPADIENFFLIMESEKADVVIGSKRHKDSSVNYSFIRKVISFIYFMFVKIFFSLPIKDTQTGLKLFKRSKVINVFPRILVKQFAYDLEVLVCCHRNGSKIVSAPVKVNPKRNFGFIPVKTLWKTFIDTIAIFYRLNILNFYDNLFEEIKTSELISIIIPLKNINDYIKESVEHILKQTYQNFEIIILPDNISEKEKKIFSDNKIVFYETGNIPPALKRDKGVNISRGSILAFIDDDTYPEVNWLYNALRAMKTVGVHALGGPAVTAPNDNFSKQISGLIYSSKLMSGGYKARYTPDKAHYLNDYPSCNFLITKELYKSIGGFNSTYWPGEDTILCNNIVREGEKILYTPEALVYHHRRDLFFGHFKQLSSYALHRGYFVRHIGGNSLSISYFLPSLFLIYLFYLPLALMFDIPSFAETIFPFLNAKYIKYALFVPNTLYLILLLFSAISTLSPVKGFCKAVGIFLSHCVYGIYFIKGLLFFKKDKNNS